jgi:hypothetical protein
MSAAQTENLLNGIYIKRSAFTNLLGSDPADIQQVLNHLGASKLDERPFMEIVRGYITFKSGGKGKKHFPVAVGSQQEELQTAMLKLQNLKSKLELLKLMEETTKLRQTNKQSSDQYINLDVLMPLLSIAHGNIANQLRAAVMFFPKFLPHANDCLEELIKIGRQISYESKLEADRYLKEFETSENEMNSLMDELNSTFSEIEETQNALLDPALNSFGIGEENES